MIPVSFGPVKEQLVNKWQTFLVFLLTKLRLDPISFVRYGTKEKFWRCWFFCASALVLKPFLPLSY